MSKIKKSIKLRSGISFELLIESEELEYEDKLQLYNLYIKQGSGEKLTKKELNFINGIIKDRSPRILITLDEKVIEFEIDISEVYETQTFLNDIFNSSQMYGKDIVNIVTRLNLESQIKQKDKQSILEQYNN